MEENVKKSIESYLEGFLHGLMNKYDSKVVKDEILKKAVFDEEKGEHKPFHAALIPAELLRIQSFFRSFSTSLGQGVFEYIAKIVAESNDKWIEVRSNHKFEAFASPNIQSAVDTFIESILNKKASPYPYPQFSKPDSENAKNIVVDLSFKDRETGAIYFIEIKSPKPNKDQTRQTKEKFLFLIATYPKSKVYYALPYNPYGERKENYRWSFTKMFFDLNNEILVGKEFWDFLGGENTYEEILRIFKSVGEAKGKEITRRLIKGV
ncbi:hypothetical protein DRN80_05625 [Methanosarcinales archaeon]|nr:TdeIII family type II restriction endonuclease [Methanophagales archaeon]MCW3139747.1 TdeIII family type II restriction endonuclease [Methanophagales archaeon]MCW7069251.1 TdeIII family type II restriction endonuclease [Methanophagales archaeon]RLG32808.1 MAG: hypothetical protein DRN80_05625 [Methanosarcinales archaeon]